MKTRTENNDLVDSVPDPDADAVTWLGVLARFRTDLYDCLTRRSDTLFELAEAVLCSDGLVKTLVDLTSVAQHRRGRGAMYDAFNHGRIDVDRLRHELTGLSLPCLADRQIVLAVDVSPWLSSDAACSPDRLFCHVYGRAKSAPQFIPGWPYSFVADSNPAAARGPRYSTWCGWGRSTTPPQSRPANYVM